MALYEAERDTARHDASMARMDADAVGSSKAKVEFDLGKVQNALVVVEEARWKAEDEASCLAVEWVSLLLELGTSKHEVSALQAHTHKEKEALREAYKEGFDVIFNYGYGYCAFAHNIYGSQLVVPYEMPDMSKPLQLEFFINPRCPQSVVPAKDATINVRPGEAMIVLEREVLASILEADISKAGEYLPGAEVGPSNEPDFSTRITEKIEDHDVFGEN